MLLSITGRLARRALWRRSRTHSRSRAHGISAALRSSSGKRTSPPLVLIIVLEMRLDRPPDKHDDLYDQARSLVSWSGQGTNRTWIAANGGSAMLRHVDGRPGGGTLIGTSQSITYASSSNSMSSVER
jgi:hypothetical protein